MKKIQIIETCSEIGAGTRGASLGPMAMKIASLNLKSDYFFDTPLIEVENQNHLLFRKANPSFAKNIDGLLKVFENISQALKQVYEKNNFPIVLAGDHSSAAGTIAGIKKAFPEKRLGVIWVDAHADLHSPYTTPSGNVHGMPLAISLGEDNMDNKKNDITEHTLNEWTELKNLFDISPKIKYEDIVFIAVRDEEKEERYIIEKNNIKNISVTEARMMGMKNTAKETLAYLDKCDHIYISFDVDSMDCHYVSHGTGTPVPVGFSEREATRLLMALLESEKICCFEITEVNPTLDEKKNAMAEAAFRILEKTSGVVGGW